MMMTLTLRFINNKCSINDRPYNAWLILRQIEGLKGICIFASGSGTNADKIMAHFSKNELGHVVCVVCDKPSAGVLKYADQYGVPTLSINKESLQNPAELIGQLRDLGADLIVLAGFLRLLPAEFVQAFQNRIVNIHPSLLPKYGGKGMYGARVHQAVIDAGDERSGITIHYVNERYDEGSVVFQAECDVHKDDSADSLATRIHELEHEHYSQQIERLIND